ncbi:MAG: hypothetical protein OEQ47_08645 [Acidimicrobiia bacterium]|nr:hypothetical protein [Acidimicrobiia bacterium]
MIGDREIIDEPCAALARAAAAIPHARTKLVREGGHLQNLQMPHFVDQHLISFLAPAG